MKTYSAKPSEVTRAWWIIDASEAPLGKIAVEIAKRLTGKMKPSFTKHIDTGDYVVVINTDNLVVTGKKLTDKTYYRHSGYPGGIKSKTLQEVIDSDSTRAIFQAVRGMIPVNKLRDGRLARLKLYKDETHGHDGQQPQKINIKGSK